MGALGEYSTGGYYLKYYPNVDNKISYFNVLTVSVSKTQYEENKSYLLLDILPDPSKATQYDAGKWAESFAKLSPRKHSFNVSIYNQQPTQGWGSGKFEIDFTGMDREAMQANAEKTIASVEDNIAKNTKLPEHIAKPSSTFGSSMLSQSNIKAIIKREWGKHIKQVLKIRITPNNKWEVALDDYRRPENKQNSNPIYIAYKGTDGKCYYIDQSILFVRDYQGNGKYSSTVRIWGHYDLHKIKRIACENIK